MWNEARKSVLSHTLIRGVPQGGIISPLLSNLVLHEFDVFIRKLIEKKLKECSDKSREINNPEYHRLSRHIKKLRLELEATNHSRVIRKELRKKIKERSKTRSTILNPQYVKYSYVRYADD